MNTKLILEKGYSQYGAQMGRRNVIPPFSQMSVDPKLHLEKLKWVCGDYDQGGAYWGNSGGSIYCAWNNTPIRVFVRAKSRTEAKTLVLEDVPSATFYR